MGEEVERCELSAKPVEHSDNPKNSPHRTASRAIAIANEMTAGVAMCARKPSLKLDWISFSFDFWVGESVVCLRVGFGLSGDTSDITIDCVSAS
jgi:hypothetical protein